MNSTCRTVALMASLSGATVPAQGQEELPGPESVAETHPMQALARLERGRWRLAADSPWGAYHRYEWGVGRRLLRSTSNLMVEDVDASFAESLFYWHPHQQVVRLLGFGTDGALFDGRLEIDGEIWSFHFDHYAEGERTAMLDRWSWDGEETYRWTSFIKSARELDPWMSGSFTREIHAPREDPRDELAWGSPFTSPEELEPLIPLIDGDWEIDATRSDGTAIHLHSTFEWGLGRRSIRSRTWHIEADGSQRAVTDSCYYWHPGRRTLLMIGIGEDGRLSEGTLHFDGDTLVFEYAVHTPEGSTDLHERWRFIDDGTVEQSLWSEAEDGERSLVLECVSRQRGESG